MHRVYAQLHYGGEETMTSLLACTQLTLAPRCIAKKHVQRGASAGDVQASSDAIVSTAP